MSDSRKLGQFFYPLLFLLLLVALPVTAWGQDEGDTVEVDSDSIEVEEWDEDWEDIDVSESEPAPPAGGFGLGGGPTFEYFSLSTASLDPDLDQDLFLYGGYGFAVISHIIVGGGGAGTTLEQPNEAYDRFTFGFGGFLTGYDLLITENFSARATLLVGGGALEMVKTRSDLASPGSNQFLERYRDEEFFMLRPAFSLGYTILGFIDLRADAARLLPMGGENASDLGEWTYGLHVFFGFRNSIN